jgi:hypothetical protein
MNIRNHKLPFVISIGVGTIVWFFFRFYTNHSNPQSSIAYWYIGYPTLILASFITSYFFSIKVWRWPLLLILSQVILGIVMLKGDLYLLPLGMIVYIVISIPCFIAGYCGVLLNKYFKDRNH